MSYYTFAVIIPRGRRKQVRTHLVRIHRGPQEGNMRQRPPPTTSRNANPPTAASRSSRRPEQRQSAVPQPPAGSNNPPVDVRQMRVEIDPDEPPPVCFGRKFQFVLGLHLYFFED